MPPSLPDLPSLRAAAAAHDGWGGTAALTRLEGLAPATLVVAASGEVAADALSAGDIVITPEGASVPVLRCAVRQLDAVALRRQPELRPVRLGAGALGAGLPRRDLLLAPDQVVRLGALEAPARKLVNGEDIRQVDVASARFVRVVIGAPIGVPGALAVAGIGCPGRAGPYDPAASVALRVQADGAARPDAAHRLMGRIEEADAGHVVGWVLDSARPGAPVPLEVAVDGVALAWGFADRRRPDLEMSGLGGGACAFAIRFAVPPSGRNRWLTVRHAVDGVDLPDSPILLAGAPGDGEGTGARGIGTRGIGALLADAVRPVRDDAGRSALASFLFSEIDRLVDAAGPPVWARGGEER